MWRWLASLILAQPLAALTADEAFQRGVEAETGLQPVDALSWFREADRLRPDHPRTLQRIARQLSDLTPLTAGREGKRRLSAEALDYALRAHVLDPACAESALSVAICHGKVGLYSDTRAKVEGSRHVRTYAEKALALNPDYDWAHHVLGRWHLEVHQLGATRRLLVRLIYGSLPGASLDKALHHLRRAVELAPEVLAHHVELGLALIAAGDREEGRQRLAHGLSLPSREIFDESAKRRAREALETG